MAFLSSMSCSPMRAMGFEKPRMKWRALGRFWPSWTGTSNARVRGGPRAVDSNAFGLAPADPIQLSRLSLQGGRRERHRRIRNRFAARAFLALAEEPSQLHPARRYPGLRLS